MNAGDGRRVLPAAALLIAALGLAGPASSASEEQGAALRTVMAQLKAGELDEALDLTRSVRREGQLSREEHARSWLLEGMALALLDDETAERAFSVALRIDRSVDPGVKQEIVRRPFERAQAALPAPQESLMVIVGRRASRPGLPGGVVFELIADDLGLVDSAERLGPNQRVPLPLNAQTPLVFVPAEKGELKPSADEAPLVNLLDRRGNVLWEGELLELLEAAPLDKASAPAGPSEAPTAKKEGFEGWVASLFVGRWDVAAWPWVTLAGMGIAAVGLGTIVVSGALIAVYDRGLLLPPEVDPLFKPAMFVGFGVGGAILLGGAVTIVVDQVLRNELYKPDEEEPAEDSSSSGSPSDDEDGEDPVREGGDGAEDDSDVDDDEDDNNNEDEDDELRRGL